MKKYIPTPCNFFCARFPLDCNQCVLATPAKNHRLKKFETDEFFGSLLNEDDLNDLRHVCRQRKIKVLLLSLKLYVQYVLDALTLSETANTENN